nr:chloroplast envelope membrane protein [Ipomoea trifida]
MSTSILFCPNPISLKRPTSGNYLFLGGSSPFGGSEVQLTHCRSWKRRFRKLIPHVKKRNSKKSRGRKSWWQKFFDEEGNWFGLKDDEMLDEVEIEEGLSGGEELSEDEKFEAWKRRAEAIIELREAQEDIRNEENRRWEDWLVDPTAIDLGNGSSWVRSSNGSIGNPEEGAVGDDLSDLIPVRGLVKSMRDMVLGREEDDILYEDRIFQYASFNSAKFLAVLIIIPWALDFLVHDYVLMPFLDRYVKIVPLAAELLDVKTSQKREMIKELKLEQARYRLEVEIGKSPPLSEKELFMELHQKALEMRDERRLENRRAFANIWSDAVFGISLFILLYFNQNKVSLLKFTGYKLINNISDTGKALLIILITDIFLGYHSESGWQTLSEVIVEHYGFEVDQAAITIFVCIFPVVIDACVKLWLFKYLPKISPKVSNIFREMKRH